MKEKPASTKASRIRCEIASSAVQPNTLPPKAIGANSMPDLPSLRFSIVTPPGLLGLLGRGAGGRIEPAEAEAGIGRFGEFDAELGQLVEHAPDHRALDDAGIVRPRRELEAHDQRGILDVDDTLHL